MVAVAQLPFICSKSFKTELQECEWEAALMLPSGPFIKCLGWKTIRELADEESKLIVYKSINGLASQYLCNFFIRNYFDNSNSSKFSY